MKGQYPINREQLKAVAPSVFAETKHADRSSRYTFIPTIQLVERLANEGWLPTQASEQRVRRDDRRGYQKHMLRFRRFDGTEPLLRVGDSFVEMVLINSHDGSSAYQLQAGLFRLVCTNGLVIPDSLFDNIRIKHSGRETQEVIEASYRIIDDVPRIQAAQKEMSEIQLSGQEEILFAESALALKYEDKAPVKPVQLLAARRFDDKKPDLWHTFNRVQENLIEKGGLRGVSSTQRRTSTRAVKGIDENVKLNKALWTLAEGMKAIKKAA